MPWASFKLADCVRVHGLIVTGRDGYAAFAFEAIDNQSMATDSGSDHQFISTPMPFDGTVLPIALVPPTMIPAILSFVHEHFPELKGVRPLRSSDSAVAGSRNRWW